MHDAATFVVDGLVVRADQAKQHRQVGSGRSGPQPQFFELATQLGMEIGTVLAAQAVVGTDERGRCRRG